MGQHYVEIIYKIVPSKAVVGVDQPVNKHNLQCVQAPYITLKGNY